MKLLKLIALILVIAITASALPLVFNMDLSKVFDKTNNGTEPTDKNYKFSLVGKWEFNDVPDISEDLTQKINFTAAGVTFDTMTVVKNDKITFVKENENIISTYTKLEGFVLENGRVVDFGITEQNVSKEFYSWFAENAHKYSDKPADDTDVPDETDTPNIPEVKSYAITVNASGCTETVGTREILSDGAVTLKFDANENHELPKQIKVEGALYTWSAKNGTVIISNPTSDVVVTVSAVAKYTLQVTTYKCTVSDVPSTILSNERITLIFTPEDNLVFPSYITVNGAKHEWNAESGELVLYEATDNVSVSVTALRKRYSVTVHTNCTYSGSDSISENAWHQAYLFELPEGYGFDNVVGVTGADYTWDSDYEGKGRLTLSDPTSDVVISIYAVQGFRITENNHNQILSDSSNVSVISEGETVVLKYSITHSGYGMPDTVNVEGADFEWDAEKGELTLSNATSNVSVEIEPKILYGLSGVYRAIEDSTFSTDEYFSARVNYKYDNGTKSGTDITFNDGIIWFNQEQVPYFAIRSNGEYKYIDFGESLQVVTKEFYDVFTQVYEKLDDDIVYHITYDLKDCSVNDSYPFDVTNIILSGETLYLYFSPNENYNVLNVIEVTGADYSFDETLLILSNPISDVHISVEAESVPYSISYNLSGFTVLGTEVSSIEPGGSVKLSFLLNNEYISLENISVRGAAYTVNDNGISVSIELSNPTNDVVITISAVPKTFNISVLNTTYCSVLGLPANITYEDVVELTVVCEDDWFVNDIHVVNATMEWDASTGKLVIKEAIGDVVIQFRTAPLRPHVDVKLVGVYSTSVLEHHSSNIYITDVNYGDSLTLTFEPMEGYQLPNDVEVNNNLEYTWNSETGVLVINNIQFGAFVAIYGVDYDNPIEVFSIAVNGDGFTAASSNASTIGENGTVTLTFTANSGYVLPADVTVNGATKDSWNSSTGELKLSSATSNVTIEIDSLRVYSITTDFTNCALDSSVSQIVEGGDLTIYVHSTDGSELPESITVEGARYEWHQSEGRIYLIEPTDDIVITINSELKNYTITANGEGFIADASNVSTAQHGSSVTLKFSAQSCYVLPADVTVSGATKDSWNSSTGELVISNPTGAVTITITAVKNSNLLVNNINCSVSEIPDDILATDTVTFVFTANTGYILPTEIIVKGAQYNWDQSTGTLIIHSAYGDLVSGKVEITVTAEVIVYDITVNATNVMAASSNATTITYVSDKVLTFTPNTEYVFPDTVTVTGATSTWDKSTGTLTLSKPTDNVTVTIEAIKEVAVVVTNTDCIVSVVPEKVLYDDTFTISFAANTGYALPENVIVKGAEYNWDQSTGNLIIHSAYGDLISGKVEITVTAEVIVYDITVNATNVMAASSNATTITYVSDKVLTFTPNAEFVLPDTVTVTGAISTWDKSTGTLTLSKPTGNVTVTIEAIKEVAVVVTNTNCSVDSVPNKVLYGNGFNLTFTANTGYRLPENVTVEGAQSSWDREHGTLIVYDSFGKLESGKVEITVTAEVIVYDIEVNATNVTAASSNATTITYVSDKVLTFTPNAEYVLPDTVTVTGAKSTWDETTGTLTLSKPTDIVTVTIEAIKEVAVVVTNTNCSVNSVPNKVLYGGTFTLKFTANAGCYLPDNITVKGAEYNWDQSTGNLIIHSVYGDLTSGKVEITVNAVQIVYDVSFVLNGVTGASYNSSTINAASSLSFTFNANSGYVLPADVTVSGATKESWDVSEGILVISNATGPVTITLTAIKNSNLIVTNNNCTVSNVPDKILATDTVILTFKANAGYLLPQNVTVTGAQSYWDQSNGTLIIYSAYGDLETNDVRITVDCIANFDDISGAYAIKTEGITAPSAPIDQGVNFASNGTSFGRIYIDSTKIEYNITTVATISNGTITWVDEDYKYIDFGLATQSVYGEFYDWFVANTTEVIPLDINYTNCTLTNAPQFVERGGTLTLNFTLNSGYEFPDSVTVSGAQSSWDQSTGTLIIYGASASPSGYLEVTVNAESKYKLSGVYKWNDTITQYSVADEQNKSLSIYINFVSNGVNFNEIFIYPSSRNGELKICKLSPYEGDSYVQLFRRYEINEEDYQTIDFGETPQIVNEDFYTWFIANATKQ